MDLLSVLHAFDLVVHPLLRRIRLFLKTLVSRSKIVELFWILVHKASTRMCWQTRYTLYKSAGLKSTADVRISFDDDIRAHRRALVFAKCQILMSSVVEDKFRAIKGNIKS